jgi:NADH:ubiquinone oxidoreductase subunit 5 (subunit L)/multisubunit Na+/H+ antiporter MnhA subunit
MKQFRKLATLTLFCTLIMSSAHGQQNDAFYEDEGQDINSSLAYQQSSHTAHWSAYVPLTALVVGAIFLGIADNKHSTHYNSSDPYNGLGSLKDSRSSYYGSCNRSNSNSCFCHH